ncbi:MAG: NAD-dependent epimerase/dehydratase family protein, partial [Pseudomonadales bacterium]|nr:NAD-dependent epimerase/dehydratase family protein [Pseudomonadales bacterium]
LFHVYGPDDNEQKFVPAIVRRCLAGESIDLTSGQQRRDFVYVDDVVEAICLIVESRLSEGYHHFDVGSGELTSIREFVEAINKTCGGQGTLNFGALEARVGEPEYSADTSRLRDVGWNPRTSLGEGLIRTVEFLR